MKRIILALTAAMGAACGTGGESDPRIDGGESIADARLPDAAPDATAECHDLAQTAQLIAQIAVAENPPVPTGGAIPDGAYHVVSDTLYTGAGGASGPTGFTHRATVMCSSLRCLFRGYYPDGLGDLRGITVFSPSGTQVTATQICPQPEKVANMTFSTVIAGSSTRVTLFEPSLVGGTIARVYELQP